MSGNLVDIETNVHLKVSFLQQQVTWGDIASCPIGSCKGLVFS
jgi:hypothetical protein